MEILSIPSLNSYSSLILGFLLKQTVYASLLFILIFLITFLLRKKSAVWRYGLWTIFFMRLIVPININIPFGFQDVANRIPIVPEILNSVDLIRAGSENIKPDNIVLVEDSVSLVPKNSQYDNEKNNNNEIYNTDESFFFTPELIICLIWACGLILISLLIIRKYLKFNKIINNSRLVTDESTILFLNNAKDVLNVKRKIKLISSEAFPSPFTKGFLRPYIFIPESILSLKDSNIIESIISHELAHIKFNDALWIRFQNLIQVIFFFNPLVWIACRQMSAAREQLCDLSVLSKGLISKKKYGSSILYVLKNNLSGFNPVELIPCFGGHKKMIKQRLENIVRSKKMKKYIIIPAVAIICMFGILTILFFNNSGQKNNIQNEKVDTIIKYYSENGEELSGDYFTVDNYSIITNSTEEDLRRSYTISRSEIMQKVGKIDDAMQGLRAGPFRVNNNIEGFKLFRVSPSNILYKYGLRSGDIVKRINGHSLDSTEKLFSLWEVVKGGESKAAVDFERAGRIQRINIAITD